MLPRYASLPRLIMEATANSSKLQALFAGRVLLIPTLAFAKISVIALIRQVFTAFTEGVREAWIACDIFIGVLAGWALMSIIALSAGCSAAATIGLSEGVCRNEVGRLLP
jgi:hypothetical protein